MTNLYANECIKCTVDNCKYHNGEQNYCSLGKIQIGSHKACPTDCKCVDCESFESVQQESARL